MNEQDKHFTRIVNVETGEEIVREMTADEIAEYEATLAAAADATVAAEAAAAKKAAILAALADATGYTADELKEALNA